MTSVLIVDDEPAVRDVISRWAASLGLRAHSVPSAEDAVATLRSQQYDLAVVDVMMPGQNGLWLAEHLNREYPDTAVVLATAYTDLIADHRPAACADLLVKPFKRERLALAVERSREWRRDAREERRWHAQLATELRDNLESLAGELDARLGAGTDDAAALAAIAAARVPRTMAHSERVVRFVNAVSRELELDDHERELIETAARFHDVGKAAIPRPLLTKPSPLTPRELAIMRRHVEIGAELLAHTDTLAVAAPIVRASHEWFGGGGYPDRLEGHAIPRGSRIIAVADAYDAMTQDRVYRARAQATDAVTELLRCSPAQFDPAVVEVFLKVLSRQ